MKFHKKVLVFNSEMTLSCPDYSKIEDISIFKGGYDQCCNLYYTSPDNQSEDKKIHIICIRNGGESYSCNQIDDGYNFLKNVSVKNNGWNDIYSFFIKEELSVIESRDKKISNIIEPPQ